MTARYVDRTTALCPRCCAVAPAALLDDGSRIVRPHVPGKPGDDRATKGTGDCPGRWLRIRRTLRSAA